MSNLMTLIALVVLCSIIAILIVKIMVLSDINRTYKEHIEFLKEHSYELSEIIKKG